MESIPQRAPRLKLLGISGSRSAYELRDFLHRSEIPYEWVALKSEEDRRPFEQAQEELPLCILPDGTRLSSPSTRMLAESLGWTVEPSGGQYDLAIYGAGPAGLSAAVYGASEGLKTILIERSAVGGQAGTSSRIENYLGFPQGISGSELADRAREQALRFGAEIVVTREGVRAQFLEGGGGIGHLADGTQIAARAAICSTGVDYRRLDLSNEQELLGTGVYYGPGSSEGELCRDEHIFIVGGGNSAGQAALYLSRFARQVSVVIRGAALSETLSSYLLSRIASAPNIDILSRTKIAALHGKEALTAVTLRQEETGEEEVYDTSCLFVCIGGAPQTDWADTVGVLRDEGGYLLTGPDIPMNGSRPPTWNIERDPYYLETSIPGMFAAGDVRHGSVKRCASAVGEGAMAVTFVHRYLSGARL